MGEQQQLWPFIASILYTSAWSISFYGQIYQNIKYKSVEGYSLNYLVLNIFGFTFYGIYSTMGYFYHLQGAGTVVIADLVFVYHGLFICVVLAIQAVVYERGGNKISWISVVIVSGLWAVVGVETALSIFTHIIPYSQYLNPVSCLGYCKLVISFVKYTPAAYWNYKRKSTKGWSIFNIILDLIGGTFSLASGTLSVSNGLNVTKVILAIVTILYDFLFIFQHYCLYNPKYNKKGESLLQENQSSNNKN